MKIKNLLLLIALSAITFLQAQLKIGSILGDNMVLQRNSEVKIWGKSKPKDKLTIRVGWDKSTFKALTDENGKWLVKVKTTEAGGPYRITIATD